LPYHFRRKALRLVNSEAKMITRLFKIMLVLAALVVAGGFLIVSTPVRATDDETAAFYNTKCKACHGAAAEKKFDRSLTDDALVQIILDGKKAEKPPNMPAFKDKGVTAEQAKALVDYMKSLK
jgi:mono/diheme cytochrome c family protein